MENQIHFIDKSGRSKVKPIALSSCMGKLLERIINEHIVWAEHNNIIHSSQNGFRKRRSCIHNLTKIMTDIWTTLIKGNYTFLNVSAAYNNVQFHILLDKLRKLNCPPRIFNFLTAWLQDRHTESVTQDSSIINKVVVRKGLASARSCPQPYIIRYIHFGSDQGIIIENSNNTICWWRRHIHFG